MGVFSFFADTRQHKRELGCVAAGAMVAVNGVGQVEMDGFPLVGRSIDAADGIPSVGVVGVGHLRGDVHFPLRFVAHLQNYAVAADWDRKRGGLDIEMQPCIVVEDDFPNTLVFVSDRQEGDVCLVGARGGDGAEGGAV